MVTHLRHCCGKDNLKSSIGNIMGGFGISSFVHFCKGLKYTCHQVLLCWHASQCPWNSRDRCVFRHRGADTDVKPLVTRTEEEIGVELAALWEAVSKLACSLMWRTGQLSTCPCRKSWRSPP